jgi:hypothetical protein
VKHRFHLLIIATSFFCLYCLQPYKSANNPQLHCLPIKFQNKFELKRNCYLASKFLLLFYDACKRIEFWKIHC